MNSNALSRVERLRIYDKYLKVYQADCDLIDALNHANRSEIADAVRDKMINTLFGDGEAVVFNWENGLSKSLPLERLVLEQYTGINDIEHNGIFEGDIVKLIPQNPGEESMMGVVKILEGTWVVDNDKTAEKLWYEAGPVPKIIGNIHENPELLGAK